MKGYDHRSTVNGVLNALAVTIIVLIENDMPTAKGAGQYGFTA